MRDYQVEYTLNSDPQRLPPASKREAVEYAIAIIKDHDPKDIRITRGGDVILSRDQIFDHPLAAGKISKTPLRFSGSWGWKINAP
jgi:hypothetical protein